MVETLAMLAKRPPRGLSRSVLMKVSRNQERPMRYPEYHGHGEGPVKPPDSHNCKG